jgi:hypothetical protein
MTVREHLTYSRAAPPRPATPALPAPAEPEGPASQAPAAPATATAPPAQTAESADEPAPVGTPAPAATPSDEPPATPPVNSSSPAPALDTTALMAGVLRAISDFLGHVLDQFDDSAAAQSQGETQIDMSLKIKLLSTFLSVVSEDRAVDTATDAAAAPGVPAAATAPALLADALDHLSAARQPRLLEVA